MPKFNDPRPKLFTDIVSPETYELSTNSYPLEFQSPYCS